jgi:hypothetical protein
MVDIERDTLNNVKYAKPESPAAVQLTTYLMLAILGCTVITFAFQGKNEDLWVLMTAPFNIAIEGNVFGNFIVVLFIFGSIELYLRATQRDRLALDVFLSGVLATYAVTAYVFLTSRIIGAGTSIVGFSVLAMSIFIILIDMATWVRRSVIEDKKYISLAWLVPSAVIVVVVAYFLAQFLFAAYIASNESAIFHVSGGIIAFVILAFLLRFMGGGLIEPRGVMKSDPKPKREFVPSLYNPEKIEP